jgi:hypothetical protein
MIRLTAAAAILLVLLASTGPLVAQGQNARPRADRPLADVLRDLQRDGLPIVFSSEVVRPSMRVVSEPQSVDPRRLLDELLQAHGLEARPGPRGVLVIARGRTPRPQPAAPPRTDASIDGLIVDAQSATPLAGVLVRLPATGVEVLSNVEGRFELSPVPAGTYRLFVAVVGYVLAEPEITVPAGATLDLTVALAQGAGTYTEEVEVVADPFRGAATGVPAGMALNSADLRELRGVLTDDPFRAVQAAPGAMTGNDLRSEFSIRGSDPGHVGLSIDGIATGWPVHSVRGDWGGGSIGLLNGDVLEGVTLLSGAYPQEQPARSGGWLELTLREGSRLRPQVHASLTMTSASVVTEGPLGGESRGSWLVAARQSFVQWILERIGAEGTRFGFSDLQGKLVFDVTPRQRAELTVVAGRSLLEIDRAEPDPNLVTRGDTTSGLTVLAWRSVLGTSATLVQRLGYSADSFTNDSAERRDLSEGSSHDLLYRVEAALPIRTATVRAGVEALRQSAQGSGTRFLGFVDGPRQERVERIDGARTILSSYARASVRIAERIAADAGLLLTDSNDTTLAPHASVTAVLGGWTARAASGLYRQVPRIEQTGSTFGTPELGIEWSRHVDVSLERGFRGDTRIQIAGYRRDDRDVLRLVDDEYRLTDGAIVVPSLTPQWRNTLSGQAYGFEVLAQRRSAAGLSGWISYTWARTNYRDTQTGETFDGDFDQRHAFNAFAQYRLSAVTAFSGKLRIGSSFPIVGYLSGTADNARLDADRNGLRLPVYARLDLRANRAFNLSSKRLTLFVEVINVFGRSNLAASCACASWADAPRVFSNGRVIRTTQEMFPFLPTAGIVIDF